MTKKKDVSNLDNNVAISAFLCERRDHIFGVDIYFFFVHRPCFQFKCANKIEFKDLPDSSHFHSFLFNGRSTDNNVFQFLNQIKLLGKNSSRYNAMDFLNSKMSKQSVGNNKRYPYFFST